MNNNKNSFRLMLSNTFKGMIMQTYVEFEKKKIPISPEHHYMLELITEQQDTIQSDLAEIMKKDKSAVMRHMDYLEKLGFIVRVNDSVDRRKKYIVITEQGANMLKKCDEIIDANLEQNLQGISDEKLTIFKEVLGAIHANTQT